MDYRLGADYRHKIEPLLVNAGAIALRYWRRGVAVERKGDGSPLTIADREISDYLLGELQTLFPSHRVITEEEHDDTTQSRFTWVVDPIDNTNYFSEGKENFNIMLCLLDPRPLFSMIYRPASNEWFWAQRGAGAHWKRGDETGVFTRKHAQSPIRAEHGFGAVARGSPVTPDIVKGVLAILQGKLDVYGELRPGTWDVWPPGLLLLECGGVILDKHGKQLELGDPTQHYDNIVVGWPEALNTVSPSSR